MFLATSHLLDAGHPEVAFLGGQKGVVFTQGLAGYKKALLAKGVAFNEDLVVNTNPNRSGGYEAMNTLLTLRPRITAAMCYNDVTAFGALSALGEKGLKAGSDIALMGFDNVLALPQTG